MEKQHLNMSHFEGLAPSEPAPSPVQIAAPPRTLVRPAVVNTDSFHPQDQCVDSQLKRKRDPLDLGDEDETVPSEGVNPSSTSHSTPLKPFSATASEILAYVSRKVLQERGKCIVHTALNQGQAAADVHTSIEHCQLSQKVYFQAHFTKLFTSTREIKACYTCWCPHPYNQFQHPPFQESSCSELHTNFWTPLAYTIWACVPLRHAIFEFLSLAPTQFSTVQQYTTWLTCKAPILQSKSISNILLVVYAFYCLKDDSKLPQGQLTVGGMFIVSVV
ncbi:hypothetical protein H0H93_008029 [Arthromyces matolae]|nr:hypothetical protein H0H93_008029 [Arthromyces matolae]